MGFPASREFEDELRRLGATFGPRRKDLEEPKAKRKPSHVVGVMSPVEKRYAQRLDGMQLAGEIVRYEFEPEKLWLSEVADCGYNPDFRVWLPDGTYQWHETKGRRGAMSSGHMGDGIVKVKWAAQLYKPIPFLLCVWDRGRWKIRQIPG
jgi:hypothetical protein